MDVLTIQWGWVGGQTISGPTPPAPVAENADGVMLISTAGARRDMVADRLPNPWAALLAWLARIDAERRWRISEWARRAALDDQDVIELTQLTRRRRP